MTFIASSLVVAGIVIGIGIAQIMPAAGETVRDKVCAPTDGGVRG